MKGTWIKVIWVVLILACLYLVFGLETAAQELHLLSPA